MIFRRMIRRTVVQHEVYSYSGSFRLLNLIKLRREMGRRDGKTVGTLGMTESKCPMLPIGNGDTAMSGMNVWTITR